MRSNYYSSYGDLYAANEKRLTICKHCVNDLYKRYVNDFGSKIDALYYMCSVLDWYFNEAAFRKIEKIEVDKIIPEYLKKSTVTAKKNPKSFKDTLLENVKRPNEGDVAEISQVKAYSSKWHGEYTAHDLEYLDNYYNGLLNDYKITTENHRDYAKKIAKASWHMDRCFERMMNGVEGADAQYTKARETFDVLSKSAKFAEQTRSTNEVGLGSFGKIVEKVEKGQYIPKHTVLEKDDIDKLLDYFQTINESL